MRVMDLLALRTSLYWHGKGQTTRLGEVPRCAAQRTQKAATASRTRDSPNRPTYGVFLNLFTYLLTYLHTYLRQQSTK